MTTRRDFLDTIMVGGLGAGGLALGLAAIPDALEAAAPPYGQSAWDTSWLGKLDTRIRAVFDCAEVERGFGVWRASAWTGQYQAARGTPTSDMSTALILRHNAVVLAMSQEFWDRYAVANASVEHPLTGQKIARNPALLGPADGVPEPYANFALPKFLERGNVALACDAALRMLMVPLVVAKDGVSADEARNRAIAGLVPGVILQPSGVFAALAAQYERQAQYIRAS